MLDTIFIFLDDVRNPQGSHWIVVRTAEDAYTLIREMMSTGLPVVASLDHDLGENMTTGYDLLNWLEKDIATDEQFRPNITFQIHSANPVGRMNMDMAIRSIMRMLG